MSTSFRSLTFTSLTTFIVLFFALGSPQVWSESLSLLTPAGDQHIISEVSVSAPFDSVAQEIFDENVVKNEEGQFVFRMNSPIDGLKDRSVEVYREGLIQVLYFIGANQLNLDLELNSPGGQTSILPVFYETLDRAARQKNLNIRAVVPSDGFCGSACAMLFLQIKKRSCGRNSIIAFHGSHVVGTLSPEGTAQMLLDFWKWSAPVTKRFVEGLVQRGAFESVQLSGYHCSNLVEMGLAEPLL